MIVNSFEILASISILFIINYFFRKKEILLDNPNISSHKSTFTEGIPLSGGTFLLILLTYYFFKYNNLFDLTFLFILLIFFIVGIISDLNKDFSASLRFLIQVLLTIFFVHIFDLQINSVDWNFFDLFLSNKIFNFFFVFFCIITFLNGLNFIDGSNGLVSGYLLLISATSLSIIFYKLGPINENLYDLNVVLLQIYSIFFIFNFFGRCFFGDNGIYISAILIAYFVISLINFNQDILSPIFAVMLLWYPAFENLITIVRRNYKKKRIFEPDNLHLHSLLFKVLYNKLNNKISHRACNSLTGILINIMLLPNFFFGYTYYNSSKMLLLLVIIEVLIYIFVFLLLLKRVKSFN